MKSRTGRKTMSNALARFAVQNVELHGLELATFLQYTGLRPEDLKTVGDRVPAHKHLRMLKYSDLLFPRDLSDAFDLRTILDVFPDLIALVINCRNLEAAITAFLQCKDILGELDKLHFTRTTRGFVIDFVDESGIELSLSAFAVFMMLTSIIRHYLPTSQFQLAIELTRPPLRGTNSIDPFIRSSIEFNQPRNRLTCRTSGLTVPNPAYNDLLNSYVRQKLNTQLQNIQENRSFASLVEKFLHNTIGASDLSQNPDNLLQQLCSTFCMSRWTVLRNLKREGESYKGLFAKVRYTEACRMLVQTNEELGEISRRLGFASQSSFTRFFKSIYGQPPLRFRETERG